MVRKLGACAGHHLQRGETSLQGRRMSEGIESILQSPVRPERELEHWAEEKGTSPQPDA